ncbi:MAG: helix-turn-helix transcriptional regulator [Firmicutes bacterium]|nr:helix-turn-helix transcriptional regulator [Bacillota bacterium]
MKNLKKLRDKLNITQVRLSVAIEVSQETISAYEAGKALPSAETLIKMANFLNTSVDYLLDLTDNSLAVKDMKSNSYDELISIYNRLDSEGKEDLIKYARVRELMK